MEPKDFQQGKQLQNHCRPGQRAIEKKQGARFHVNGYMGVCVRACVRPCMRPCMRVCVRACARGWVCVCVYPLESKGSFWIFVGGMTRTNLEVYHDVAGQPLESQSRFFGFVFVCLVSFCFCSFVSCGPPNL